MTLADPRHPAPTNRTGRHTVPARVRPTAHAAARLVRLAQRLLLDVAAVVGVLCIVALLVCLVGGIRPAIVVSGSMAPDIPVGALTVARTVPAETVEVGEVVTVPRTDGHGLVTHRIISSSAVPDGPTTLRLQGDANEEPDALPYSVSEVGQVLVTIPHVGRLLASMQHNLVAVVAGLAVLTVLLTVPPGAPARSPRRSRAEITTAS